MPSVGFSSVKRVPRKCLVAEPSPRSMSMRPFAPDFPDLEFEKFQIVHVPFLTGWTVGGRAGIPAILILVGFSVRASDRYDLDDLDERHRAAGAARVCSLGSRSDCQ